MLEETVVTPGGRRPRSHLQRVEPGRALYVDRGRVRMQDMKTKVLSDFPAVAPPSMQLPALGSGWITTAYWDNGTGDSVTSFRTTWRVPPAPKTQSKQLIYLFSGITRFSANNAILQPVLQWGASPDGGGDRWAVASWYVHTTGQAYYTPLVDVNPGDVLVGSMAIVGQANGKFDYDCEFVGIDGTLLPIRNVDELLWCSETLEAYDVQACSDYPDADFTTFQNIDLRTGASVPKVHWSVRDTVTTCGQHTVVVEDSATDGQVDVHYR